MPKVISDNYTCPNCGANLDPSLPSGEARVTIRCEYCGKRLRVRQEPAPTRRGGDPSKIQIRLRIDRARPRPLVFVLIGLAVGLPFIIGLVFFGFFASHGTGLAPPLGAIAPGGSKNKTAYPRRCRGNENLSLDGETLRQTGTIVEASGSCKVSIRGANLTSDAVAIIAREHAVITVSNSNVRGATGAILASGSAHVSVDNTAIQSPGTAVRAAGSAEVSLVNATLSGDEAAYMTEDNGKVTITDTRVTGPVPTKTPGS